MIFPNSPAVDIPLNLLPIQMGHIPVHTKKHQTTTTKNNYPIYPRRVQHGEETWDTSLDS